MKKVLLVLILSLCSLPANAQTQSLTSELHGYETEIILSYLGSTYAQVFFCHDFHRLTDLTQGIKEHLVYDICEHRKGLSNLPGLRGTPYRLCRRLVERTIDEQITTLGVSISCVLDTIEASLIKPEAGPGDESTIEPTETPAAECTDSSGDVGGCTESDAISDGYESTFDDSAYSYPLEDEYEVYAPEMGYEMNNW